MAKLTEATGAHATRKTRNSWGSSIVFFTLAVVGIAFLLIQLDTFEAVPYPIHEFGKPMIVPTRNNADNLPGLEKIGLGQLIGAEDIAYEPESGVLYTGCQDGWIKRVKLSDSVADLVVENWVHTGGRPLGIAIADSGDVFVADAYKGLLKVSIDGKLELVTNEAEGVKVRFADGVAIAKNGMVYFTDASTKYGIDKDFYDLLEGAPHGRFLSYDPSTKQTKLIAQHLYFANGVEVSPNQDFVIFCESLMRRCSRYYIQGERKGSIDVFAENLPGIPDNIHYDGDGHYLLAIAWESTLLSEVIQPYPFVRKILAFTYTYLKKLPTILKASGVIVLDLEGKPVGGYYDEAWTLTTSSVKIGKHLYMGSFNKAYILRLNLTQNPFIS